MISPSILSLLLFHFSSRAISAADGSTSANNNNSINSIFPQLVGLQRSLASSLSLRTGSQDFTTHCCLLAVNDSLSVSNGSVNFTPTQSFIAEPFEAFTTDQFPCDAKYNGNESGAPTVSISYAYCKSNCPGWQRSKSSKLNQWVSPFVGFLVPSVVFCLAIPRRYVHLLLSLSAVLMPPLGSAPQKAEMRC